MLVLTRNVGQSIMIGDDVRITITEARGRQIRVAIDAPRDIPVNREEIYERIQQEKEGK